MNCGWRRDLAVEYIMTAWHLNNPSVEITQELREELGISNDLVTRDQIVEHYFQLAAKIDAKNSAAYYNMGLFYVDGRDCDKAKESLRKHLALIPGEQDAASLLGVIEKEGCAGGRLFLEGMDEDERRQFLGDHPEIIDVFDAATSNNTLKLPVTPLAGASVAPAA